MADEEPRADEVEAGQRVYTPFTLRVYDLFVLGFSNRFVWRCRSSKMLERYESHVGAAPPRRRGRHRVVSRPLPLAGRESADHPARPERELTVGGVRPDPSLCARDGSGERVGSSRPRRLRASTRSGRTSSSTAFPASWSGRPRLSHRTSVPTSPRAVSSSEARFSAAASPTTCSDAV